VFTGVLPGFLAYLVLWTIMRPMDGEDEQDI
jgi:phage shock protein PspC (stress-responsive transcriptional regulator)